MSNKKKSKLTGVKVAIPGNESRMDEAAAKEYLDSIASGSHVPDNAMEAKVAEQFKSAMQRRGELSKQVQQLEQQHKGAKTALERVVGEYGALIDLLLQAENERRTQKG